MKAEGEVKKVGVLFAAQAPDAEEAQTVLDRRCAECFGPGDGFDGVCWLCNGCAKALAWQKAHPTVAPCEKCYEYKAQCEYHNRQLCTTCGTEMVLAQLQETREPRIYDVLIADEADTAWVRVWPDKATDSTEKGAGGHYYNHDQQHNLITLSEATRVLEMTQVGEVWLSVAGHSHFHLKRTPDGRYAHKLDIKEGFEAGFRNIGAWLSWASDQKPNP